MDTLPNDVFLAIVGCADVKTTLALMGTNKRLRSIIIAYQRSITKASLAKCIVQPRGHVLSSDQSRRRLKYGTFKMRRELEKRESRINQILSNPTCVNLASPPGLGPLTFEQQKHLFSLLKRAMLQCDYIADIAVNDCEPVDIYGYEMLISNYYELSDLVDDVRHLDPYTNYPARPFQLEYIKSLPTQDIVMMYYLKNILGASYLYATRKWMNSDPVFYERVVFVEECVLRHGSWFTWAKFFGGAGWRAVTNGMENIGLVELTGFELGEEEDALPSLQSGLIERFNELHSSPENSILSLRKVVKDLITGVNEDERIDEGADEDSQHKQASQGDTGMEIDTQD
ncbi:uncharacterized protein F4822DRAFT_325630 [Hypoxylon trugodes]|uniref:uncharacterized protein n=1 Tax=Hypoxylon trugodes TaxID=326681 RepID=UPI00219458BB|nr:uncharacterized protein F4822DRAFT_325630 [Hypoxylon trugodes]KAI1386754.1 hypothetical protein F4822DRAFT_325630 [Hypoxylon trugodes]